MNGGGLGIGVVALSCALLLFGRAMMARQARGEPIKRWAVVWSVIFATAFVVAIALDRR